MLKDLWPTSHEIAAVMPYAREPEAFRRLYGDLANANPMWKDVHGATGQVYDWPGSTYIARPPFFDGFTINAAGARRGGDPRRARARHLRRLGDDRPHLARRLDQADLARRACTCRSTTSRSPTSTATARGAATTR